ncbi:MAG: ribosomal protection-like ABC-F family protein [Desulfatibacillaceae bacterium]
MSLVTVNNLSLYYADRAVLEDAAFQVAAGDRIGLVGRNGSGKTSLLRILGGMQRPSSGTVRVTRGARVGYLPQDISEIPDKTVLASVLESIPGKSELEGRIAEVEDAIAAESDPERQVDLAEELARLHEDFEHYQSMFAPHLAERILCGLGFSEADFDRLLEVMSGGWRMRAALAAMLYQKPDVLLMDEPTNHLDVPSVRWLGEWLKGFRGALVLVCHDREFLNEQINRVISFETEGLRQYKGDYDSYLVQREEEEKVLERQARNQEQKVKEAMKFVEKFRYKATKARQAQSKIKMLEKMEMIEQHKKPKAVHFSFPEVEKSGRNVIRLDGLSKAYGDHVLYDKQDMVVQRGDRVGVIGPNGSGKTTLLRIVAGEIKPDGGQAVLGHNVTLSYYAQHQAEQLDPQKSVVDEVATTVPGATHTFVRNVCGAFLFTGDEVDKPTGVLSGGEKARVALAKLLVRPGNCLLMDEPTNHLDIVSSDFLIDALRSYEGTLLFVSHNRSFVNRLATRIWDIRDGEIIDYPGNLREYFDHLDRLEAESAQACVTPRGKKSGEPEAPAKEHSREAQKARKRADAERRKVLARELGPIKKRVERVEAEIAATEAREQEIVEMLKDADFIADATKSQPVFEEYGRIKKRMEDLYAQWEKEQEKLEAKEREIEESGP